MKLWCTITELRNSASLLADTDMLILVGRIAGVWRNVNDYNPDFLEEHPMVKKHRNNFRLYQWVYSSDYRRIFHYRRGAWYAHLQSGLYGSSVEDDPAGKPGNHHSTENRNTQSRFLVGGLIGKLRSYTDAEYPEEIVSRTDAPWTFRKSQPVLSPDCTRMEESTQRTAVMWVAS